MQDFTNYLEDILTIWKKMKSCCSSHAKLCRVVSLWHWFELAVIFNLKCMYIMGDALLRKSIQLKFFYRLQCMKVICKEVLKQFHRTLNITVIATRRHCWRALKWVLLDIIPMHLAVFYVFSQLLILEISNQGSQHEKTGNGKCYARRRCLKIAYQTEILLNTWVKIIDTAFNLLSSGAKHSILFSTKAPSLFSISCTLPTPMMSYILISP